MSKLISVTASLLFLVFVTGCGQKIVCTGACGGDEQVCKALQLAGDNRPELEAVLNHYQAPEDSLKLEAAHFLIGNMEGQSFYSFVLLDSLDIERPINVLDYPDYTAMVAAFDSVEAEVGELHWDTRNHREDLEFITGDYLIKNIDLAFQAWQTRPWARNLSFADFRDNVLPYRGSNEPREPWRGYFLEKYADLPSRMQDPTDPVEASILINQDIKTWFEFDSRFYRHPTDQGLQAMLTCGLGRCEDMTNLAIYAMRANGLAVTSDYTPHWADCGNNHAWNAIMVPGAKAVPFMGCLQDPGVYHLRSRMAKAYRKSYARNYNNLFYQRENPDEKLPGWLRGRSYTDVTTMYTPVADVLVKLPWANPEMQFAYLCVFNSGEWKPIHGGEVNQGRAVFTDMGVDICYLPMCYQDDKLVPAGECLILDKEGRVEEIKRDQEHKMDLRLVSTTRKAKGISTDSIATAAFETGVKYELFTWDREWVSLGTQTAGDGVLLFQEAPAAGLFWLVAEGSRQDERIFTWDGTRQIWW